MNNWLSTSSSFQFILPSSQDNIIFPALPVSPVTPVSIAPQPNPPILFLPK
jgi:hypothetical protein